MHYMGLEAVDLVLRDPVLLRLFRIPSDLWPAMRKSWGLEAGKLPGPGNEGMWYQDSTTIPK
jgi:glutathionylspermidine synthase